MHHPIKATATSSFSMSKKEAPASPVRRPASRLASAKGRPRRGSVGSAPRASNAKSQVSDKSNSHLHARAVGRRFEHLLHWQTAAQRFLPHLLTHDEHAVLSEMNAAMAHFYDKRTSLAAECAARVVQRVPPQQRPVYDRISRLCKEWEEAGKGGATPDFQPTRLLDWS